MHAQLFLSIYDVPLVFTIVANNGIMVIPSLPHGSTKTILMKLSIKELGPYQSPSPMSVVIAHQSYCTFSLPVTPQQLPSAAGEMAMLECSVPASVMEEGIQWVKLPPEEAQSFNQSFPCVDGNGSGSNISESTIFPDPDGVLASLTAVGNGSTLMFNPVEFGDEGAYVCYVGLVECYSAAAYVTGKQQHGLNKPLSLVKWLPLENLQPITCAFSFHKECSPLYRVGLWVEPMQLWVEPMHGWSQCSCGWSQCMGGANGVVTWVEPMEL